jgi:hypothetical protein
MQVNFHPFGDSFSDYYVDRRRVKCTDRWRPINNKIRATVGPGVVICPVLFEKVSAIVHKSFAIVDFRPPSYPEWARISNLGHHRNQANRRKTPDQTINEAPPQRFHVRANAASQARRA